MVGTLDRERLVQADWLRSFRPSRLPVTGILGSSPAGRQAGVQAMGSGTDHGRVEVGKQKLLSLLQGGGPGLTGECMLAS